MAYPHEQFIADNGVDMSKMPETIKAEIRNFNGIMRAHSEEKRMSVSQKLEVAIATEWAEITANELEESNASDEEKAKKLAEKQSADAEAKAVADKLAAEEAVKGNLPTPPAPKKEDGVYIGMFRVN